MLALEWLEKVFEPGSRKICGNLPRLLIFDGHGSHITYEFVLFCINRNILLLCLPSHSTHLLQPLDVGLFSPYQHFYGQAVDNYMRSGQNHAGIKKAVFIPFLTFARDSTFTSKNITQAFLACGISPLNPWRVLGKVAPLESKRRNTLGVVKHPETSRDIRGHIQSATNLLAAIQLTDAPAPRSESQNQVNHVSKILRDLGHQLEEHIAEKEIWRDMSHRLQGVDKIYNATDRRKLSEARALGGKDLRLLRDACLEKDEKSAAKRAGRKTATRGAGNRYRGARRAQSGRKPKALQPTTPQRERGPFPLLVSINETPQIALVDSEDDFSSTDESEELSDEEWSHLPPEMSSPQSILESEDPPIRSSSRPDQPLHMSLRSRRLPLPFDGPQ